MKKATKTVASKKPLTLIQKNAAFWKLSKDKKKVAIAKDVIKHVQSGFYTASPGTYVEITTGVDLKRSKSFQQALLKIKKEKKATCEVCGIGAAFCSLVNLGNKATTADIHIDYDDTFSYNSDKFRPLLAEVFESIEVDLIESAFERSRFGEAAYYHPDLNFIEMRNNAVDFGWLSSNPEDRLIAIMQRIIDNKGKVDFS